MYLFYEKETENRGKVNLIYYIEPSNELKEKEHIKVTNFTEAEKIEGKISELYVNPIDKTFWYEYKDKPKTDNELLQESNLQMMDMLIKQQIEIELLKGGTN